MSDKDEEGKLFFVREKELAALFDEIKGNQSRAEILLEGAYTQEFACSRESKFYLMELTVTSEACLAYLERVKGGKEMKKSGEQGYKLTTDQLGFLTNYAIMNKNICLDLLESGITITLQ